jgi:hypothetical protein
MDGEGVFMINENDKIPLMTLAVGSISNATRQFADIREITELAAESRRRGGAEVETPIATEW